MNINKNRSYFSKIMIVFMVFALLCVLPFTVNADEESDSYTTSFNGRYVTLSADLNKAYSFTRGSTYVAERTGAIARFTSNIPNHSVNFSYFPYGGTNYTGNYIPIKNYEKSLTAVFSQSITITLPKGTIERVVIGFRYDLANGTNDRYEQALGYNNGVINAEIQVEIPENCINLCPYYTITINGEEGAWSSAFDVTLNVSKFELKFIDPNRDAFPILNIITPIVESSTDVLGGLGTGAVDFFTSVFLDSDGTINTFSVYLLAFVGIGMAIGIMRWIRKKSG